MNTTAAKANLVDAMKLLRAAWDRAKTDWSDPVSQRFEREVIDALEPRILAAVKAIDHVAELAAEVKRECGNDEGAE